MQRFYTPGFACCGQMHVGQVHANLADFCAVSTASLVMV